MMDDRGEDLIRSFARNVLEGHHGMLNATEMLPWIFSLTRWSLFYAVDDLLRID